MLLVSILLNSFEYGSRTLNEKLTKSSKPHIIPVINPPDCIILGSRVFENFILADEPSAKALQNLATCVSVNNNLCGKLVLSELLIKFVERLKKSSFPFFVTDFNLCVN